MDQTTPKTSQTLKKQQNQQTHCFFKQQKWKVKKRVVVVPTGARKWKT